MTVDIRLPEKWSKGSSGGAMFNTRKVPTEGGKIDRERRWLNPKWQYEIAHNIKSPTDMAAIRAFHLARGGSYESFLFKDWIDYASTVSGDTRAAAVTMLDQPLGTGDGVTKTFSLIKRYSDAVGHYDRPILWPVDGTLRVAKNGVLVGSGVSVNRGTGIVTFTVAPAAAVVLTAGFEFDVPVHFEEDFFSASWDTINSQSAGSIALIEERS